MKYTDMAVSLTSWPLLSLTTIWPLPRDSMKKTMSEIPEHERPREKLLAKGAACIERYELVAVLLGKGTRSYGCDDPRREDKQSR